MIFLHKLLPLLVAPFFIITILTLIGLVLRRLWFGIASLALLWALSLPMVADSLWRILEQQSVRPLAKAAPTAYAIVVLSGMTRMVQGEEGAVRGWADGADRFWAGLELYKAGRAPKLIFTGGQMPWAKSEKTEGQWLRDQALAVGVPEANILVTQPVSNTSQEAQAVSQLLPGQPVLLVTSAFHMPRACAIFQAAGLQVHPFPVDLRVTQRDLTILDFVPSAKALDRTSDALREWLGRSFYAMSYRTRILL